MPFQALKKRENIRTKKKTENRGRNNVASLDVFTENNKEEEEEEHFIQDIVFVPASLVICT